VRVPMDHHQTVDAEGPVWEARRAEGIGDRCGSTGSPPEKTDRNPIGPLRSCLGSPGSTRGAQMVVARGGGRGAQKTRVAFFSQWAPGRPTVARCAAALERTAIGGFLGGLLGGWLVRSGRGRSGGGGVEEKGGTLRNRRPFRLITTQHNRRLCPAGIPKLGLGSSQLRFRIPVVGRAIYNITG